MIDVHDVAFTDVAPGMLRTFNEAGVLVAADVHVASRLAALSGSGDETVALATALAVRAPRLGHVCVDLNTIAGTAASELDEPPDLASLPWPSPDLWLSAVSQSYLAAEGGPLRLDGSLLYLDRYWREERDVASELLARSRYPAELSDVGALAESLNRLFPGDGESADLQRLAAGVSLLRRFSVIAGGPGTGKTTTAARALALFHEQAAAGGARVPLVALAAPTGKAAARLEEAVHDEASRLNISESVRTWMLNMRGTTLHRLLARKPGSRSRFRHDRNNRLAHDVVVVDETSMVSLSLMARLLEAVRDDARLVLLGDPEQLASIEAGAVLGDLVGPAVNGLLMRPAARSELSAVVGEEVSAQDPPADTPVGDGIVVLRKVHRFGGAIAELAAAIQVGDADGAVELLGTAPDDVLWLRAEPDTPGAEVSEVRTAAVESGRLVVAAARDGRAADALAALGNFRVLCAHRHGPSGSMSWMARVEGWLSEEIEGLGAEGEWYAGRPLLVTANDYSLRLYNGDTGVVVRSSTGRLSAAFERGGGVIEVSPTRLAAVDTVYAMTVHKSQGSQFDTVAVLLPGPASPLLTRELLYTAVTRARRRVILASSEESLRTAITRPISRSSGLGRRLWEARP